MLRKCARKTRVLSSRIYRKSDFRGVSDFQGAELCRAAAARFHLHRLHHQTAAGGRGMGLQLQILVLRRHRCEFLMISLLATNVASLTLLNNATV